ncbi:hypothetical protein F4780DRAFT_536324 [Xylariomycetidae sp. FL0641]|nr:hypothetical protein F4780DRAFT_536324 [Xylariomycetidae sp. FL0641]
MVPSPGPWSGPRQQGIWRWMSHGARGPQRREFSFDAVGERPCPSTKQTLWMPTHSLGRYNSIVLDPLKGSVTCPQIINFQKLSADTGVALTGLGSYGHPTLAPVINAVWLCLRPSRRSQTPPRDPVTPVSKVSCPVGLVAASTGFLSGCRRLYPEGRTARRSSVIFALPTSFSRVGHLVMPSQLRTPAQLQLVVSSINATVSATTPTLPSPFDGKFPKMPTSGSHR